MLCNNIFFKTIKRKKSLHSTIALKLSFYLFIKKDFLCNELSNDDVKSYIDIAINFLLYHQSKMFNPLKDFFFMVDLFHLWPRILPVDG